MSTTTTTEWTVKPGHIGMGPSVIDASGNVVCHIPAVGTHAERMRIADRIAATPELLELLLRVAALRKRWQDNDDYGTVDYVDGLGDLHPEIEAAIAAADGGMRA